MDVYNSIFVSNIHKRHQNIGNLLETFWVDKFQAYFCGNLYGRESHYFEEISNPQKSVWGMISTLL